MIQPTDILALIATGETETIEFKRTVDNPESVAGEIVALANLNGGFLLFGVEDDGVMSGLSDTNGTFQSLTNICRDRCISPVSPILEQVTIEGKDLIILPELNRQKPYRTAGGRFYVRVGRDKKDAADRELLRIAQAAGELHYDESPVWGTTLADFSTSAFDAYHRMQFGMSVQEQLAQSGIELQRLLHNLRLIHELDGQIVLSVS